MTGKTLIFIPTYDECKNASRMCEQIHMLGLDADVLFVDDASPDGTGRILEEMKARFPRLIVQHRNGKLGIGSAHFEAIQWAYDQGYQTMVTMDCDFTHSPSDIPGIIAASQQCDLSVGSRWAHENSLPGWNIFRRCMTSLGHFLTSKVLGIPQDASGAFRAYRLDRLPRELFHLVKSRGYSFFFESLFIFNLNGFEIVEVPIVLPARTYGHSKMSATAAFRSARYIFQLYFSHLQMPERFLLGHKSVELDSTLSDPQDWDSYWEMQSGASESFYALIAGVYRRAIIKRNLERTIRREFPSVSTLLHAGCGSGQVDTDLHGTQNITAIDISSGALHRYALNNPSAANIRQASIFTLPFANESFDGIYNLGVLEHFNHSEIFKILGEFHRVLRKDGKIVIFWPHHLATSVLVLHAAHFVLNKILQTKKKLHPPEISLLRNQIEAEEILSKSRFRILNYEFGIRDFFIQAVIVAQKLPE